MNEVIERYSVHEGLAIFLQRNSKVWLARFKIDGRWITRTTKERAKDKAITAAIKIKTECDTLHAHGIAVQTKTFKEVARLAIEEMEKQPPNTKGYVSLETYRQMLEKYHIPFFGNTNITRIDYAKLAEFDAWRIEKMRRIPAQSTLKMNNAALQRVFDLAVDKGWMTKSRVPKLSSKYGRATERRDYFTPEEVDKIIEAFPAWIDESRKTQTRHIRQLLYYYFNIAIHTGLRPGTEMDNLRWNDIVEHKKAKPPHVVITVRKGKNTLHTGSRHVVADKAVLDILLDLHEHSLDDERMGEIPSDYNPLVFRLPDGSMTDQLGRNFSALVKKLDLEEGPDGKRTLYSLRHTHITLRLLQGLAPAKIAKQCGTSPAMIQQYYDHMKSPMYAKEILGGNTAELNKLIIRYADLQV